VGGCGEPPGSGPGRGRAKTLGIGGASEARRQAKPSLSDIMWPPDTPHPNRTRSPRVTMSTSTTSDVPAKCKAPQQ